MLHVVPIQDTEVHVLTTICPCGPRVEIEPVGILVTHNAFDERHDVERFYEETGLQLPDDHIGWEVIKTEE